MLRSRVRGHRNERLWGSVGEACPTPSGACEMESPNKDVSLGLGSITRDRTCGMTDNFALAIVTGVRVSEMERLDFQFKGSVNYRGRPHSLGESTDR